jgi:hypothetical protein
MAENVVLFTSPLVTATEHRCASPKLGLSVDSGTRRNGLSKADLDVSAKLPE